MFKIFRKIRLDMFSQSASLQHQKINRRSRYLIYALGEIALVMIGILLALQVSNWNEQRKERTLEKRYLSELLLDLQADSVVISEFVKRSDRQLESKNILMQVFSNEIEIPKDSLVNIFNRQWQNSYGFNPITTTLDEMKSTGNIGVIRNSDLRRKILEVYNNYQVYINNHEGIYDRQQEEVWKLLFAEIPHLYPGNETEKQKGDIESAITNYEIRNRLLGNYVRGLNSALHQLQDWNEGLIKAIREERNSLR